MIHGAMNYTFSTVPTGNAIIKGLPFTPTSSYDGVITAIANNIRKVRAGTCLNGEYIMLWSVNSDSPWLWDHAVWGSSSSDVAGYKIYSTSGVIYFSGVYQIV